MPAARTQSRSVWEAGTQSFEPAFVVTQGLYGQAVSTDLQSYAFNSNSQIKEMDNVLKIFIDLCFSCLFFFLLSLLFFLYAGF